MRLHAVHAVTLQGKKLKEKKSAQHHAWRFEDGAYIETTWDRFKAGLGDTVVVQTGTQTVHVCLSLPACMHAHHYVLEKGLCCLAEDFFLVQPDIG